MKNTVLIPAQGRSGPISAKLFCKHSQVAFMPDGVVLKDERPTENRLNVEHRTSNIEHRIMILSIFNFIVKTISAINPTLQYPKTHFSNIPAFQHSNRTTLRLSTGWGEAPNLFFCFLLFSFKIRCWMFDVRCSSFQCSMFYF